MSDEPNSANGHEPTQNEMLPPELQRLTERLSADGTFWQSGLPDMAGVVARIRAVPLLALDDEHEGDFPMSIQTPPIYGPPTGNGRPTRPGPGRGFVAALAAVLVVALLAAVLVALAERGGTNTGPLGQPTTTQPVSTSTLPAATATPTTYPVQVYFSKNPDSYNDVSAVFGVGRIAPQANDATFVIEQLIAGPTAAEVAQGYFTELTAVLSGASNCGGADFTIALNMKGSTPQNGTATLTFCRATQLPGDLSGPRIKAEITKTLTQFSGITSVVILGQDGQCFDDFSGANMCLH